MMRRTIFVGTTALLAWLLVPVFSQAIGATITWKTGVSGDWSTASNWEEGVVPTASDEVVIPASATDVIRVTWSAWADSISIGAGSTLTVLSYDGCGGWYNSTLTVGNGVTNNGAIDLTHTGNCHAGTSTLAVTAGVLLNQGAIHSTVADSGSGGRVLSALVDNQGTINVSFSLTSTGTISNTGTINLNGTLTNAGILTNTSTINVAAGATLTVNGGILNQDGGAFTGAGTLVFSGSGTGNFNAPISTTPFGLNASLQAGTYTLTGTLDNVAMTATGSATVTPFTIGAGAMVAVSSYDSCGGWYSSTLTVADGFTNNGTIELTHGGNCGAGTSTLALAAGILTNMGTIHIAAGTGGGGRVLSAPVDNRGIISVEYSMGYGSMLTNTGTISIGSGTSLTIGSGGTLNQDPGGVFTGAGTLVFAGTAAASFNAPISATPLGMNATLQNGAELTFSGIIDNVLMQVPVSTAVAVNSMSIGAGAQVLLTSFDNCGGWGDSSLTVANGVSNNGMIELTHTGNCHAGTSTLAVTAGVLLNQGTISSTVVNSGSGGRVLSAQVDNQGTINVNYALTSMGVINNTGVINVNGTLTNAGTLTNMGAINIASGTTLTVNGGALNQNGGAFTGAGTLVFIGSGTGNFNAPISATPFGMNASLQDGGFTFTGTLDNVSMTVTGSASAVPCSIGTGALVAVSSYDGCGGWYSSTLTVAGGFTNNGTIELTHAGNCGAGTSTLAVTDGVLTNMGTIHIAAGTGGGGRALAAQVDNRGIISADYGTTYGSTLTNSGTISIASGISFIVGSGGTLNQNAGGVFTGAGTLVFGGTAAANFNAPISATPFGMNATLQDGAGLTFTGIIDNVLMQVPGDTAVLVNSMSTGGGARLLLSSFDTCGSWGDSTLTVANGLTNSGTIELTHTGNCGAGTSTLVVTAGVLLNEGTISSTVADSGTGSRLLSAQLDNRGSLNVSYPLTVSQPSAGHTNSGVITIAGGRTLTISDGTLTNSSGQVPGIIQGDGVLAVGGIAFSNAGHIDPGSSPGTMSLTGNLAMTGSGVLNIELAGTALYDQLIVNGSAALAGTLAVNLVNGFVPNVGDSFRIMRYGSNTGEFTTTALPGGDWSIAYNADSVDLTLTGAANLPIVSTAAVSEITTTTASSGGNVTSDGGEAVTAKGVCWNTTGNPTTSDPRTIDGAGIGPFTSSITGLTANSTYHVRAYATNAAGTTYGNELTFLTENRYSIAGIVTNNGLPLSGVTVTLTGPGTNASTVTGSGGSYSFAGLQNGVYTITPTKDPYAFSPSSITATVSGSDVTGQNFTSTFSYTISGTIANAGAPLSGVTVNLTGDSTGTFTTGPDGVFTFAKPNGHYTITPVKDSYTFTPQNRSITVDGADVSGQDFSGSLVTHTISGTITSAGRPLSEVTVTLTGSSSGSVTTGAEGTFQFTKPNGSYTITPTKPRYAFSPADRSVTVNGTDVTGQDFTSSIPMAGISLWYRADSVTDHSDGDPVEAWSDQSGNGLDLSATGSPTFVSNGLTGKPTIRFDHGSFFSREGVPGSSLSDPTTTTAFFLLKQSGDSARNTALGWGNPGNNQRFLLHATYDDLLLFQHGSIGSAGGSMGGIQPTGWDDAFHEVEILRSGSYGEMSVDGSLFCSDTEFSSTLDQDLIETLYVANDRWANGFKGEIAEIIVYRGDLSDADRQTIKQYLDDRYFPYSVAGRVTHDGSPLSGVTIHLTGAGARSADTCEDGAYSITTLPNGTYTVTPSMTGYTFTPASLAVTINDGNVSGQDFVATPTQVKLIAFTATGSEDHITVNWRTGSELDNAGFHLWRSKGGKDSYTRITETLIPAEGGPFMGASYNYEDYEVVYGKSYRYKLEDIDTYGVSTFHGPVQAAVGTIILVSPENGASTQRDDLPLFLWESTPYDRFRIQLSTNDTFKEKVVTLSGSDSSGAGRWLRETSYTPTALEWDRVRRMIGKNKTVFWRVFGKDRYGSTFISEVNALKVRK